MPKSMSKSGVVMFTTLLMLLTCEVATRMFARIPRDISQRDPIIGRRFEPGISEYIYNYEIDAPVYLRTNRFGFRGAEFTEKKPLGVRRIAILGDSYTASMALPDEQTFCGQLQQVLNDSGKTASNWKVLNFGIFGSGTGQELALYRHLVREFHPDIVIVAFGNATDIRDNSPELSTNPIIQFDIHEDGRLSQLPQSNQRIRLSNTLNRISHFYTWQKMKTKALKQLFQKQADLERGRHLIYARQEPAAYTRAWKLTATILKAFRDECLEDESRFMVVAIPSAYQVYPDYFAELKAKSDASADLDPSHPDKRLEQICLDLAVPFLSLTSVFRAKTSSGSCMVESEHLFIGGKTHLSVNGSRIAASEMSSWIAETQMASNPAERY